MKKQEPYLSRKSIIEQIEKMACEKFGEENTQKKHKNINDRLNELEPEFRV